MIGNYDLSLVDWSRAQFALTTMIHWLFVPLTLGLGIIIAIMETLWYKTKDAEWEKATKFWMKLFGINFVIGVATGIILEFEFGINWSRYSWFVGDIFGAPLAIEGIMAFFLESTFIVVMFFGWNKVSKKFHLWSTWLTALGANLSAVWILVANAWMQDPCGMFFNPDSARTEMINFWQVIFSPTAVNKFMHTAFSSYLLASIFVVAISCWYLLKKKELIFARKSIIVASIFGLITIFFTILTGDSSAYHVTKTQPMKMAAAEGLYFGQYKAPLVTIGILSPGKNLHNMSSEKDVMLFDIKVPGLLSFLFNKDFNSYVPGINDLINGNPEQNILSAEEKMKRGQLVVKYLEEFKQARKSKDDANITELYGKFYNRDFINNYCHYYGYGLIDNPDKLIPSVPVAFYSFHLMVALGFYLLVFLVVAIFLLANNILEKTRWFLILAIITLPLTWLTSQLGWVFTEFGRQPWAINNLLPTFAATSNINPSMVKTTFFILLILLLSLLTAEISIIVKQIKSGPTPK